jgi:hypothetical protein
MIEGEESITYVRPDYLSISTSDFRERTQEPATSNENSTQLPTHSELFNNTTYLCSDLTGSSLWYIVLHQLLAGISSERPPPSYVAGPDEG